MGAPPMSGVVVATIKRYLPGSLYKYRYKAGVGVCIYAIYWAPLVGVVPPVRCGTGVDMRCGTPV